MRAILLYVTLLSLLLAAPAYAGSQDQQKLAVVVQAGSFMNQPWLESTRGEALLKNLLMYLNTTPAQVDLKIWWVEEHISMFDKQTWPRPRQHELFPGYSGEANPLPAIKEAVAWLKPGGSLLYIGNQAPSLDDELQQIWQQQEFFCHVLALAPQEPEELAALAFAGGGGYFEAPAPNRVGPFTGAALRHAVTDGRLQIITHDGQNQRLNMTVTLERNDILVKSRPVACWRTQQMLPGSYRIIWPQAVELPGPADLPERLSVTGSDAPQLHVGGTGSISVRSLDSQQQEQNWTLAVLDASTGKLWESKRESPFTLKLPVGIYRIYSIAPERQEWRAGLEAGQNLEHAFGPKGSVLVEVPGPGKNWQVPLRLHAGQHQPALRGQSGVKLQASPGNYLLSLETVPQTLREITLAPGQDMKIEFPAQGAIMARRAGTGAPKNFAILDLDGATLARSAENRQILVQPGKYKLQWDNNPRIVNIEIEAGQVYVVEEPRQ